MIKHIVCFKLSDGSEEARKKAKDVLLGMIGKVPTAKDIKVHTDELHTARSFDVILEVLVDDWKALDEYQADKYHCSVVKEYMHANTEKSIALDFNV